MKATQDEDQRGSRGVSLSIRMCSVVERLLCGPMGLFTRAWEASAKIVFGRGNEPGARRDPRELISRGALRSRYKRRRRQMWRCSRIIGRVVVVGVVVVGRNWAGGG
ncbi:hypothetical protein F4824DRAFT_494245 [Ustulina deusta]|nr:hypothetical protein F4824DRAFT_494245 [Ustulina deusta]